MTTFVPPKRSKNLTDMRNGKLVFIQPLCMKSRYVVWEARCDCGNSIEVLSVGRDKVFNCGGCVETTQQYARRTGLFPCKHHGDQKAVPYYSKAKGKRWWCNVCRQRCNRKIKDRKRQAKRELIQEMGGGCNRCGYNECVASLDFHHLDPTKKDINLGSASSVETLRREAKKCILLCANCHRSLHFGLWEISDVRNDE